MELRFAPTVTLGIGMWLSLSASVIQAGPPSTRHLTHPAAGVLDAIEAKTESASADARIYQWKRVSRETLAVVSDAKRIHGLKDLSDVQRSLLPRLDSAVVELRSASFHHSVDQVTKAAGDVVNAVHALEGK